jgi:protein-disulfide isomerase
MLWSETMSHRRIAAFSMVLAASLTAAAAMAADAPKPPAAATPAPAGQVYREFVEGKPNAKVTVIEYASLTCPHCAHFTQEDYPALKKDYIDNGKIKYIYRDFPLDNLALGAALLARCAPGDKGMGMVVKMFNEQTKWIQAEKPIEPLTAYAKETGMSDKDVDACLQNKGILDAIRDGYSTAANLYKVQATPTFLIGDDRVDGADYAKLKQDIDKALSTATK